MTAPVVAHMTRRPMPRLNLQRLAESAIATIRRQRVEALPTVAGQLWARELERSQSKVS